MQCIYLGLQSELSLWTQFALEDQVPVAELGATYVAYSPLGRGMLTGSIQGDDLAEKDAAAIIEFQATI